jgi:hypothetical protein
MEDARDGKRCLKCGEWKSFSEYHRNRSKPDGYQSYCKPCIIAANAASRDKQADYWREHYRQRMRNTYPEQGAERRAKSAIWYAEKGREWHKRHRQANPEKYREATRRWQRKENNSSNAIRRRRANKVGNGGSHTEAQWQALAASYDFCCAACGKRPTGVWPDVLCRDHVVPLAFGGTDDIGNIQPLCNLCNVTKGNRHSTDFRKSD